MQIQTFPLKKGINTHPPKKTGRFLCFPFFVIPRFRQKTSRNLPFAQCCLFGAKTEDALTPLTGTRHDKIIKTPPIRGRFLFLAKGGGISKINFIAWLLMQSARPFPSGNVFHGGINPLFTNTYFVRFNPIPRKIKTPPIRGRFYFWPKGVGLVKRPTHVLPFGGFALRRDNFLHQQKTCQTSDTLRPKV